MKGIFYSLCILMIFINVASAEEQLFIGTVTEVDCNKGLIGLKGKGSDPVTFHIIDKTEFKFITGCEEIRKGGNAFVRYSDMEGRKVISLIKYRAPKSEKQSTATDRGKTTANLFMGRVGSVDCEKGVLTLQRMDDRSKTETFSLDKDTAFSNIKGCSDIKHNLIVAIRYGEDGDRRVVKTIKPMIQERK